MLSMFKIFRCLVSGVCDFINDNPFNPQQLLLKLLPALSKTFLSLQWYQTLGTNTNHHHLLFLAAHNKLLVISTFIRTGPTQSSVVCLTVQLVSFFLYTKYLSIRSAIHLPFPGILCTNSKIYLSSFGQCSSL